MELRCIDLLRSDTTSSIYHQLLNYPQEMLPLLDLIATETFQELFPDTEMNIQVRPFDMEKSFNMRSLNPSGIKGFHLRH